MGIKGKMWRVMISLYVNYRSCVYFNGNSSEFFYYKSRCCSQLYSFTTLFLIYINGLLCEIEKSQHLADDFVEAPESKSTLQSMITIVYNYSRCQHFEASVKSGQQWNFKNQVILHDQESGFGVTKCGGVHQRSTNQKQCT